MADLAVDLWNFHAKRICTLSGDIVYFMILKFIQIKYINLDDTEGYLEI